MKEDFFHSVLINGSISEWIYGTNLSYSNWLIQFKLYKVLLPKYYLYFFKPFTNYEVGCKLACDKRQAENTADRWPGSTYQHSLYESVAPKTATFTMMFIKICHYACNIIATAFS